MSDQNYWDANSPQEGRGAPGAVNSSQATQPFRSGTTDAMPFVEPNDPTPWEPELTASTPAYQAQPAPAQPQPQYYQYARTSEKPYVQAPPQQKKGSGAKTFLFGFMGAFLACVLAFGGFNAWQTTQNKASLAGGSPRTETTIGTKDPSVINAIDEGQSLAEAVAAKALPSVVYIGVYATQSGFGGLYGYSANSGNSTQLEQVALGSGIILTEDGYILTNYHVVEGAEALKVTVEGIEYDAEVIGTDASSDLAVIKAVDASGLVAADIGDSDSLVVGEWVMSVGCPFGLEQSVATGVVSATSRSRIVDNSSYENYYYGQGSSEPTLYPNMIQTDAAINPGNSGGALVDSDGKVIGVNTLIASYSGNYSGVGFAIPINYAINIAQQIMDGKTPTHAKLGVSLTNVTSSIAKRYNLPIDYGAYVTDVSADSGADNAGIEVGDIIIAVDGQKIGSATDLTLQIRAHNPGDTIKVTADRNGSQVDFEVTLGSDEDDLAAAVNNNDGGDMYQNPYGSNGGWGNGGNGGGREYSYEDILRYFGIL